MKLMFLESFLFYRDYWFLNLGNLFWGVFLFYRFFNLIRFFIRFLGSGGLLFF